MESVIAMNVKSAVVFIYLKEENKREKKIVLQSEQATSAVDNCSSRLDIISSSCIPQQG